MDEQMNERQKQKLIKSFQSVEASKLNTSMENIDARLQLQQKNVQAMSAGLSMMERLNIQKMGKGEHAVETDRLLQEKDIMQSDLERDLRKRESAKMKKKDREKAARERFEARTDYAPVSTEDLIAARTTHINRSRENPLPEDWKSIRLGITGNEFAPDLQGQVNAENLLERQRLLSAQVKGYEEDRKNGNITQDQEIVMETNKELLKLLNNTVKLWFASGGVDVLSGKTLSSSKTQDAKKQLGLALEQYHDAVADLKDTIGKKYLERLKKDHKEEYQNELKRTKEVDQEQTRSVTGLNRNFPRITKDNITKVRSMIEKNPELYQKNKALVDQIYQEFLSTAQVVNEQVQPLKVLGNMINRRNSQGTSAPAKMADDYLKKQLAEFSVYSQRMDRQMEAILFLLGGSQPENLVSAMYLKQEWGISTEIAQSAEKDMQFFAKTQKELLDNLPEDVTEEERQLREEWITEFMRELNQARKDLRDNPKDLAIREKVNILEKVGNSSPSLTNIRRALTYVTNENVFRTIVLGKRFGTIKFWDKTAQKEISMPAGTQTRDTVAVLTPIFGETPYSVGEILEIQDRVFCLTEGKGLHLDRTVATEKEQQTAFQLECQRVLETAEEMRTFMDERPEVFHNPNMTYMERLQNLSLFQAVYRRMQTLVYTSSRYYEIAVGKQKDVVTDEQREALAEAYVLFRCLQDLSFAYSHPVTIDGRLEPDTKQYSDNISEAREKIMQIDRKAASDAQRDQKNSI